MAALDLKQLRAFVFVADLGSFTKAAALLNVTQPALSRQIRLLEEDLGTRLFQRMPRGISLTVDGTILFEQAESIIKNVESIKNQFDRSARRQNALGVVSIGIPAPASRFLRDSFFEDFEHECPGISLRLVEGFSGLIHEWLLSGSIELAVLYGPSRSRMITAEPLVVENLFAFGAPTEENLARSSITLTELAERPLILPHQPHIIRELMDRNKLDLHQIYETDATSVMLQMARAGRGYTILPFGAADAEVLTGRVVALPIVDPPLDWEVSVCYSNLRPLSEPAMIVLAALKGEVRQLIASGAWKSASMPSLRSFESLGF